MIVKKIISHVYAGILKGFALSMTIPLIISVIKGDGIFHPVSPELTSIMKNEINAVLLQIVMCVLLEVIYEFSNYIWQIERLNIIFQCILDFLTRFISFRGCMIVCHWYSVNNFFKTVYISVSLFLLVYILIAVFQINFYRIKIKRINEKISKKNIE